MFQFSRQTLYKGSQICIFCIQNILKLATMVQGLLGPLMHCLMPRKSFLCNFGIDFAFYNLARCLAWPGSRLNIFGLKTGSLGWRKDTNRIYIFTTRQSGGWGAGELVRHLQLSCWTQHPQLSDIPPPSFLRILERIKISTG